jgi:hypothetical protein
MKRSLVLLFLLLLPATVVGQGQLLSYSLKPAVQKGQGYPQVYLKADSAFRKVELLCERSDGETVTMSVGSTSKGQTRTFDLKQPEGELSYDCEARGHYGAGDEEFFDLYFRFDAFLGGGLSIEVPREEIDLKHMSLVARVDRVPASAHLRVVSPDGVVFDEDVSVEGYGAGEDIYMEWTGVSGTRDVLQLDVNVTDRWGFYAFENLYPWSLAIDHEEILFDTGEHVIKADEQPKIDDAYSEMVEVVARYSKYVEVRLYIAGYTDTVGDPSSNQSLSDRRARSIAQAFRGKGFAGPIWYQGFGERALAVQTEDSVDEVLNRRAVYLLASRPPVPGPDFPRGAWKKL